MKLLAQHITCTDGRHSTQTTYRWFDNNSVEVRTVSGDDEWDSYNDDSSGESVREVSFNALSEDIKVIHKEKSAVKEFIQQIGT
ncbi:hypothetical protein LC612_31075 [Nostoc sp. CHAB 5834]|nr:hypothetical protein [Nostoc sp. CHAB 5834]